MGQWIAVSLIVAVAAVLVARHLYRALTGRESNCSNCPMMNDCTSPTSCVCHACPEPHHDDA